MTSAALTPSKKTAPAEVQLVEGQDQNTYQENRTMKDATPTLTHTADILDRPSEWTRRLCRMIEAERRRQNLSRQLFGALMNVSTYKATAICTAKGRVTVWDLVRASAVLGFSLEQFMRDADPAIELNHFVKKSDITRSIVFGVDVRALCGDRFVVEPVGDGEVADSDAETCPLCSIIYAGIEED